MKRLKNARVAVIEATSGTQFEYLINDKMDELAIYDPQLTIEHGSFFRAYITYTIETRLPETITERFEMCGLHITCKDCPQFEEAKNRDGSRDRRAKYGYCRYRDGRAYRDMTACEQYHIEILKKGLTPDGEKLPEALQLSEKTAGA